MLTNTRLIRVQWGDCDPAGIVFYPRYFEWFDAGTILLFEKATGLTKIKMLEKYGGAGLALIEAGAKFAVPSQYGDDIEIETSVKEFGRSSFSMLHRVTKAGAARARGPREARVDGARSRRQEPAALGPHSAGGAGGVQQALRDGDAASVWRSEIVGSPSIACNIRAQPIVDDLPTGGRAQRRRWQQKHIQSNHTVEGGSRWTDGQFSRARRRWHCSPCLHTASAQGTIKIGVILPFSGQFADFATQMDNGIKLYMKQKGDTVAGKKIEIIRKDTGGVAPDVATRLAQELVTRDNVDILAGNLLSPNAIAISKVSAEAKKFMVIMNAATTVIITMSPYSVRSLHDAALGRLDRRRLGLQERHPQGLHDGVGLRPGQGRGSLLPGSLQGGGRRDRRLGAHAGRQPGLLRLRAARQGPQSRS